MQPRSPLNNSDSGFEEVSFAQDAHKLVLEPAPQRPVLKSPSPLPSIPLQGFGHSLVPDMVFGWRPKLLPGGPIPLIFNKRELPTADFPTIYHGFRPRDSMVLHQAIAGLYPQPVTISLDVFEFIHRRDARLQDLRPFVGMSPGTHALVFESKFESGNLDRVVQLGEREYDLYMRPDANTKGYFQWFYFSAETKDEREVRFNVLNFTKTESLYRQGMLPFVLSQTRQGWHRAGADVKYAPSKLTQMGSRSLYSLSFTYRFPAKGDKVYFASAVPYTFSRLYGFLGSLQPAQYIHRETLCKTLSGIEVPLVTITNPSDSPKEHVVVTGRIHPGETHASWVLEVSTK